MWTLPCVSVAGTRWTRCTPASCLNLSNAFLPSISRMTSRYASVDPPPPEPAETEDALTTSAFHELDEANREYIRIRSPAKMLASEPPTPALISMRQPIADAASPGSRASCSLAEISLESSPRASRSIAANSLSSSSASLSITSSKLLRSCLACQLAHQDVAMWERHTSACFCQACKASRTPSNCFKRLADS